MSLKDRLLARISRLGPMSVADYMAECLHDPDQGYYTQKDPLGQSGDFVTAPEISQMFGELIGLWIAQVWKDQGRPAGALVELGPGRGTLMKDVLRACSAVLAGPGVLDVHLVEASPVLQKIQAAALSDIAPTFHTDISSLPKAPIFLIANEFFDALPIRQFQMNDKRTWQERQIGVADGQLIWGLAPPTPLAFTGNFKPGMIVETCAPGAALAQEIGRHITTYGGAALFVDYGDSESMGNTFQAVQNHAYCDPLAAPGTADLTAHVAFGPLADAARPAWASSVVPQGVFLERLGITARAQALARHLSGAALENHIAAHRRLTHPEEMGTLFKVMAVMPQDAPAPPGLDPINDVTHDAT